MIDRGVIRFAQPVRGHFSARAREPCVQISVIYGGALHGERVYLRQQHGILQTADYDNRPVMAVGTTGATLAVVCVDEVGGGFTVLLQREEDTVVDLAEEDLAAVRARRMVARQVHASDHTRLVSSSDINCHLRGGRKSA